MKVIFDIDDTLYKEVDFLKSAFQYIQDMSEIEGVYECLWSSWQAKKNPFDELLRTLDIPFSKNELLELYRYHTPTIELYQGAEVLLDQFLSEHIEIGIITDGRTITQINKINALGLNKYIKKENIVISESFGSHKPDERNYKYFMSHGERCVYIADNTAKDFIAPNNLGWMTICLLDDGQNIHRQDFMMPKDFLPQLCIKDFSSVSSILL